MAADARRRRRLGCERLRGAIDHALVPRDYLRMYRTLLLVGAFEAFAGLRMTSTRALTASSSGPVSA
jgi:hypothetical protein